MEVKCLNCGGVMFKKVSLDEKGHLAMDANARLDLEHDGNDSFFRCPHCSAKNVVVDATSPQGLPQVRISHIMK